MAEYKFKATAQATKVAVTETDAYMVFDGRVSTIPSELWLTNPSINSIRVYDSTDTTELERYVVHFDAAAQEIQIWIKITSLSDATDTELWFHCGGEEKAQDASPYAAHWPLEGVSDISANENTLTNVNSTTFEAAEIEDGPHFNGANQYLQTTTIPGSALSTGSIGYWFYMDADSNNSQHTITYVRNAAGVNSRLFCGNTYTVNDGSAYQDTIGFRLYVDGATKWYAISPKDATDAYIGSWVHCVIVQNGTIPVVYINGEDIELNWITTTDRTLWINDIVSGSQPVDTFAIGAARLTTPNGYWDGLVDNVVITENVWSANEVLNHYNNENDPDTFWVASEWQAVGAAVPATSSRSTKNKLFLINY